MPRVDLGTYGTVNYEMDFEATKFVVICYSGMKI